MLYKRCVKKTKELWNSRHPDSKISTNNSKSIWEQLRQKMSSVCERESCLVKTKMDDLEGMINNLEK